MSGLYCLQAIETHSLGPTDHRGRRVVATCYAGRIVVPWDYELPPAENAAAAATALIERLGWRISSDATEIHIGATRKGYVVVQCVQASRIA